jgi:hypothetical protein
LDIKYPTWLKGSKLNKGSGYGNFGGNTSSAWSKYGAEYTKSIAPITTPTPKTQTFTEAWNVAKSLKVPSFIWSGLAYDTISGKRYADPSIIKVGDNVYAKTKLAGYYFYDPKWTSKGNEYWSGGSSNGNFYTNQLVGKVVAIKLDNGKQDGFEIENTYKPMVSKDNSYESKFWVYAPNVTKVKPSVVVASFDGQGSRIYQV